MPINTFEGHRISDVPSDRIGPKRMLGVLRSVGYIAGSTIQTSTPSVSPEEEAKALGQLPASVASTGLARARTPLIPNLRAIVRDAWTRFGLPMGTAGIDIGSGAGGQMVADFIPDASRNKFVQLETSAEAVNINKNNHPDLVIAHGSYLHLSQSGLRYQPVITGLSSLDATQHMELALREIRDALAAGGYLLHMQDTRPGFNSVERQLRSMGVSQPYNADVLTQSPTNNVAMLLQTPEGKLDVIELFRRRLGEVIRGTDGMELLCNDWITASAVSNEPQSRYYDYGIMIGDQQSGRQERIASAVVTIARKKS